MSASVLAKLFGRGVAASGAATATVEVAKGVADIVERWAPGDEKKQQMQLEVEKVVQSAAAAARQYDPRTQGTTLFSEVVNVTVDAVNRMIRPSVAVMLIGAVFGWWPVQTKTLDPIVLQWGEAVMVFYFGARTLFKDVPELLRTLREIYKPGG